VAWWQWCIHHHSHPKWSQRGLHSEVRDLIFLLYLKYINKKDNNK
jgi:hypothetical protein